MDRTSDVWAVEFEVRLLWLGTLPSASDQIRAIRCRLENLISGPGHFNEFIMENPLIPPTVLHDVTGHIPDAAAVAVGVGSCATSLSPWSCPFRPESFTMEAARRLIETRIDARTWIARLSRKTLVCNCRCKAGAMCWAWLLRSTFIEWFGDEAECDSDSDDVPFEDADAAEDEVAMEQVTYRDEIEGTAAEATVPAHVPWPSS